MDAPAPSPAGLDSLRERLLVATYRIAVVLVGLLMVANVVRAIDSGWKPLYSLYLGAYGIALLIHSRLDRLPRALSIGFLLGALTLGPLAGFWTWGIIGNTTAVLLAACTLATVLGGTRGGFAVLGTSVLGLAAMSALVHAGRHAHAFDPAAYMSSPTAWTAAIFTIGAMAGLVATQLAELRNWLSARVLAARQARQALVERVEERRQAEEALRRGRTRFRLALQAAPDGIALVDPRQRAIVDVNPAFERLSGRPAQALRGSDLGRLPLWADPGALERLWSRLDAPEAPGEGATLVAGGGDGARALHVTLRRVEGDEQPMVLLVARDVTADVQAAEKLRGLNEELERRVERRSRTLQSARRDLEGFINAVTHDLRAPLRSIEEAGEALRGIAVEPLPELGRLRDAASETARLVEALLELSRINRHELRREPLDLTAMAEAIARRQAGADPAAAPAVRVAPGLSARADPALVQVVLENLLSNARKFSSRQARPAIEVGTADTIDGPAYFVRDNGAGFDMAWASKLFEPFERLHGPDEFPGIGIGLAMVARAVHRHGGRAWAESSPGAGATFWFTLEAVRATPPALLLRGGGA